jgi:hypothetical protein
LVEIIVGCYYYASSLHILIVSATVGGGTLGGASASHTSGSALAVGGVKGEIDVLLGVGSHEEGGDVDNLLADSDVSLSDEHAGVVDGLGQVELEDLGLQSALHEDLGRELQDVIEGVLVLRQESVPLEAADEGRSLEQALGVLVVEGEQHTGSLTHLGEHVLHSPDLSLAAKAVLSAELELLVETLLLVRASHRSVRLALVGSE